MIHSARPTVSPVANIVFCCFVLLDFEKWGRTTCAKTMIPTDRDCGSAEWIKNGRKIESKAYIGLPLCNNKAKLTLTRMCVDHEKDFLEE